MVRLWILASLSLCIRPFSFYDYLRTLHSSAGKKVPVVCHFSFLIVSFIERVFNHDASLAVIEDINTTQNATPASIEYYSSSYKDSPIVNVRCLVGIPSLPARGRL